MNNGQLAQIAAPIAPLVAQTAPPAQARGLVLNSFGEMLSFSETLAKSGLAPKGVDTKEKIFVALEMGLELGFSPMQAIQSIGVINGRPAPYGDALAAVVRNSGACAELEEWYELNGAPVDVVTFASIAQVPDEFCAVARTVRRGEGERVARFSVADAKRARLWGKDGPWTQYFPRMLRFRARTFLLRDVYPDVVRGFRTVEELRDMDDEEATPLPPTTPPLGRNKLGKTATAATVEAAPPPSESETVEAELVPEPAPKTGPHPNGMTKEQFAEITRLKTALWGAQGSADLNRLCMEVNGGAFNAPGFTEKAGGKILAQALIDRMLELETARASIGATTAPMREPGEDEDERAYAEAFEQEGQ